MVCVVFTFLTYDLPPLVLPLNTLLFSQTFLEITNRLQPLVASFSWQPAPHVPPELMNLINKKIVDQDAARRKDLQRFKYYLDGENTIRILFGKVKEPETVRICSHLFLKFAERFIPVSFPTFRSVDGALAGDRRAGDALHPG